MLTKTVSMPKLISRQASRILDYIYPAQCQLCQCSLTHGRHLCECCKKSLGYTKAPFCKLCGACYDGDITSDFSCPNCHDLELDFEFARAPLHSDNDSRALLHDYKYLRQIHLSAALGDLINIGLDDPRFEPYLNGGTLIPVPLHPSRMRKRKFNQSEELAIQLQKRTGLEASNALKRIRNTATQTRFSRSKRLENLRGAFGLKARYKKHVQGKRIILVDDVFTTGSTANECSKVLLNHEAKSVAVLTLIRG
ncbi:MAG: ComF family protein [Akkermansiaceae bacterium]|nr:ComF family protein [Akkermansiaceae bacterium]